MTPEEIVKVLREVDAEAKASEGDYYADQYAWHGAGEIADAVEQMAAEIARLREEQKEVVIPGPSCDDDWLPDYARGHGRGFNDCRRNFIAALTKAGVAVKEVGQ
jgi:hypothetical protein